MPKVHISLSKQPYIVMNEYNYMCKTWNWDHWIGHVHSSAVSKTNTLSIFDILHLGDWFLYIYHSLLGDSWRKWRASWIDDTVLVYHMSCSEAQKTLVSTVSRRGTHGQWRCGILGRVGILMDLEMFTYDLSLCAKVWSLQITMELKEFHTMLQLVFTNYKM